MKHNFRDGTRKFGEECICVQFMVRYVGENNVVMNKNRSLFGKKIREARAEQDIGLRELARRVGIDYSRLSRIERGERPPPDLQLVLNIARALRLNRERLLALAGVPEEVISSMTGREGVENWIPGRVSDKQGKLTVIRVGSGSFKVVKEPETEDVLVGLRPEDITLFLSDDSFSNSSARNRIEGRVTTVEPQGNYNWVIVDCGGFNLKVAITDTSLSKMDLQPGKQVFATFKATAPVVKSAE